MSRRKDSLDHESLREKLIAVAEALVTQGGAGALTARALSLHMGYSVGHIYNLIPDLPALIRVVNGRTLDRLQVSLKRAMGPRRTPGKGPERLSSLTRAYLTFCTTHPHLWGMVLAHEREDDPDAPTKPFTTLIRTELKALCPKRSADDLRHDTLLFRATLHGLGILARAEGVSGKPPGDPSSSARLADHLVRIWTCALGVA